MASTHDTPGGEQSIASISALQAEAWAAWNASYHTPAREAYRALGNTLYQQDVHERIESLFARLDQQNSELDRHLRGEAA